MNGKWWSYNYIYIKSIQKVLNGELEYAKFNKDSILVADQEPVAPVKLSASEVEIELRKEVDKEDKKIPSKKSK